MTRLEAEHFEIPFHRALDVAHAQRHVVNPFHLNHNGNFCINGIVVHAHFG